MAESSFKLTVRTGPNPGMVHELTKEVILLGRDVTNEVVLGDSEVSRQHARLTRTPGGHVLEDLGSTNGTFVNGERLMAPRVLNHGDTVGFGENITMVFEGEGPEAAATVAGTAAAPPPVAKPAPQPVQATPPAPAPVAAAPPPQPVQEKPRRRLKGWPLAAGGCLVMIVACGAVLFFMPASWWCVLLTPLRILGYDFPGC